MGATLGHDLLCVLQNGRNCDLQAESCLRRVGDGRREERLDWTRGSPCFNPQKILIECDERPGEGGVLSSLSDEPWTLESSSGREPRPGGEKFWSQAWHSVLVGLPSACGVGSPCCGLPLSGTPVEGSGKIGRSSCLRLVGTQGESCSVCRCRRLLFALLILMSWRFGGTGPPRSRDGGKMMGSKRRRIGR